MSAHSRAITARSSAAVLQAWRPRSLGRFAAGSRRNPQGQESRVKRGGDSPWPGADFTPLKRESAKAGPNPRIRSFLLRDLGVLV